MGRGAFLVLLLVLTAMLVWGRSTSAVAARRQPLDAGMTRLFDGPEVGLSTTLVLNGRRIVFSSGSSVRDGAALLEEAVARCGAGDGVGIAGSRALRDDDETGGTVACVPEMAGGKVGGRATQLRVERKRDRTRWTLVETDAVFDFQAMFPADADAPGIDLGGVPRPEGSRRILSSYGEGHPYAMTMYALAGTPEAGASRYRDALQRAGWNQVGEMAAAEGGGLTFAAVRGHRWISVTLVPDGRGNTTVVVLGDHGGAV